MLLKFMEIKSDNKTRFSTVVNGHSVSLSVKDNGEIELMSIDRASVESVKASISKFDFINNNNSVDTLRKSLQTHNLL